MKTASIPSLRVAPELRRAAEGVLKEGESLSSFVEQSIKACIDRRRLQAEFLARGMASREEAKRSGEYFSADEIHRELDGRLNAAEAKVKSKEKARR